MDNFREEIAVRRKPGLYNFLYMLAWAMLVLSGLVAVISLQTCLMTIVSGQFDLAGIILLVVSGGGAFLLWRYKDLLRTEYEYSFTNGLLDVAMVLNNSRRRYLTALDMKNVEACGSVAHQSFQRYLSAPGIKKHNWFLNREAKLYYFYFVKNAVKHIMVVELSDEMVELARKPNYMNYGVWQG